jgi:diguanylate cyclase
MRRCAPTLRSCLALAELRRLALTDALTGLPNRRALDHELDRVDADSRRTAILFVDVDGLREANNTLGYDAGDRLIRALAVALREAIDAADFAAREGGDELVVIVRDPGRAREVAKRVQAAFSRQPLPPDLAACSRGASAGVAVGRDGEAARDVVRRAAQRMRSQKRRRKARVAPNHEHPPPAPRC